MHPIFQQICDGICPPERTVLDIKAKAALQDQIDRRSRPAFFGWQADARGRLVCMLWNDPFCDNSTFAVRNGQSVSDALRIARERYAR